ncbi:MAG: ribonuclease J [Halobacteriovoraceae bacterium]|nr:ribonuclease J [Halobacteriovoraceae bacterium]
MNKQVSNPLYSIQPIGGLKQIGSNITAIKTPERWTLIDIGILFPNEDFYDINYLIPDITELDEKLVTDIVFTHGHEDHIGAVHHLIHQLPDITLWATPFTAALIREKLHYKNISANIKIFRPEDTLTFGDITIDTIHVNHSIPETRGLFIKHIKSKLGVFFASDFKVDLNPLYEPSFEFEKLLQLKKNCSKTLMMIDSTNILNPGKTIGEKELLPGLEKVFKQAPSRIIATMFSSNLMRVQTFLNLAEKFNRKIALLGRSIERYIRLAEEAGVLKVPQNIIRSPEEIRSKDNALFLVSGCQGDFFSSLRRLVDDEHSDLRLNNKDTVVFSSKVIPGNEKKIYKLYNTLAEKGIQVITSKDELIHASGHPGQEDLKIFIEKTNPDIYIPIHGESYFLLKHQEFIQNNYPDIETHLLFNFDQIDIDSTDQIRFKDIEELKPIIIHGDDIPIERSAISERRKMALNGHIFISYMEKRNDLFISQKGLPEFINEELENLSLQLKDYTRRELKGRSFQYKKDQISGYTKRFMKRILGYRPLVSIHLH